MYREKIDTCTLSFRIIMSDFEKELDKDTEKRKGRVAKGVFRLTFDGVRDNKDSIKRKTSSSRKRKRAIIIYEKYIIYKRPAYKNLKACYYGFPKITPKGEAPSTRTQEIANRNLKKKYIKEKLAEIRNKHVRTAKELERFNQD